LRLLASRSRAADLLALVPAAALPLVFLHARYQAHTKVGPLHVYGSDVVIALTLLAAVAAGVLYGWQPLLRPWRLWLAAAALLALFAVSCFWRPLEETTTHLITAAKFAEYALLAPATVLLFRRRAQVERFLVVFVVWSVAASGWGLLQFLGLVNEFEGRRPGQLEPSFLGNVDFAVFSGATLAIGLAGVALGARRWFVPVAVVSGAIGVAIAAQVLTYGGVVLMAAACVLLGARAKTLNTRRVVVITAVTVAAGAGVLALRSYDTANFLRFLGIKPATANASSTVQTSSQRTMLAYIGFRIWLDHPILGVGFERSSNRYQPYIADAKRKFPQAAYAFPSPKHQWGVQSLWVQLLADTGIVGLVLGAVTFGVALTLALKARAGDALVGAVALGWILVAVGAWTGMGIVAGIPLDAVTWFGFGLAATVGELA
jgi:O-antigen ligase/polysaccharide polymerase Wzy-like membrane protein